MILEQCTTEDNVIITDVPSNYPLDNGKFQVTFFSDWYFAWCDLTPEDGKYFVNKYDLKTRM